MEIKLSRMFEIQKELDATIAANHNISYATTRPRRIMALLVEIGELANATRCFKYWSNKPSETKERVLDEYADGLHFFLSLGIDIGSNKTEYEFLNPKADPTEAFHEVYHLIDIFKQNQDEKSFINAFQSFFDLLKTLGFSWQDADEAYYKKVGENYRRQQNNY